MADIIISAEGLGKKYRIEHLMQGRRYTALRDVFAETAKRGARRIGAMLRSGGSPSDSSNHAASSEDFWALKDVSFEIKQGEVVGIIGRNGAGKSTLLKILSRITEPTEGRVKMKGRVASLLEVGTGFHPELTGRENISLNGAILGMSRNEIRSKFDEIVAFADIEKFLDTPVKHYSSGMYVRLAFAVAAHLEPEVLIVDEVLAVGDAQFQKKCMGKMQDVATKEGRTVLFVSHNMAAVATLCGKAIHMGGGRVLGVGETKDQIAQYSADLPTKNARGVLGHGLDLKSFSLSPNPVQSGDSVSFSIELAAASKIRLEGLAILVYSSSGARVAILDLRPKGIVGRNLNSESLTVTGSLRSVPLVEGDYQLGLYLHSDLGAANFLDLASLQVTCQPRSDGYVPYPAAVRGCVELELADEAPDLLEKACNYEKL
jgi:lipopolysaccharide transport system ATP-binding protein